MDTEYPENWGSTPTERLTKFVSEWRRLMAHRGRDGVVYELHAGGDRWCAILIEDVESLLAAEGS